MHIQSLNGVYTPTRLKNLRPLLEAWRKLMHHLAIEWQKDKDCPWWYLERTAVGFFSATVWSQGGEAIEEYGTDKKSRTKKKKKCNGRGDVMFSVNGSSRKRWFVAEAKQSHPPIRGEFKTLRARIRSKLKKARQDAVRCKSYGYSRLGLLFLCPYATGRPPDTAEIREWVDDLKSISRRHKAAVAWTFPNAARKLFYATSKTKEFYPGVALLIKRPRHSKP